MAKQRKKKPSRSNILPRSVGIFFYWLRYRIGEYCLRGFVRILPWLPKRFLAVLVLAAEKATFALLWKYRRRMEENLIAAFGRELPFGDERGALLHRIWRNFAKGISETGSIMDGWPEKVASEVAIEGEEHLKRAVAEGKGVIALSAHVGNFTMIGARLAAAGYRFSVVVKQPRDRRFARLIDDYRARVGIQTISAKPRREAVRGILKALRANGVVLMIADEFKSGGVPVNFFGRTVSAPRGPATLALRTGAATLPMFATRDFAGRLALHIGAKIDLVGGSGLEESVAANTVLFTRHLEEIVRRYPDQWNWLGFPRDGRIAARPVRVPAENPTPTDQPPSVRE
jgi:KDO2-lipid IV(A) lauroyltransferase